MENSMDIVVPVSICDLGNGNIEIHSYDTGTNLILPKNRIPLLIGGLLIPDQTELKPETLSLDPIS